MLLDIKAADGQASLPTPLLEFQQAVQDHPLLHVNFPGELVNILEPVSNRLPGSFAVHDSPAAACCSLLSEGVALQLATTQYHKSRYAMVLATCLDQSPFVVQARTAGYCMYQSTTHPTAAGCCLSYHPSNTTNVLSTYG
jgi:hypothetical protein